MNLQGKIDRIKNNLDAQSYTVAAGEAVKIIEIAFRKLLIDGLALLSDKDRLKVMQAILEIGKGERGVESFGLGQMLAVLRKSKFNDAWERCTNSDLSALKMINLDALNEIRIKLTHNAAEASKFEAEFLFHALEGVIQAFGIMSLEKQEPVANKVATPTEIEQKKILKEVKQADRVKNTYDVVDRKEKRRLAVQKNLTRPQDLKALQELIPNLDGKNILDIGCNNGDYIIDRLTVVGELDLVANLIGIDIDEQIIQEANKKHARETFDFVKLDSESNGFLDDLLDLMEDRSIEGFDLITVPMLLLHLKKPYKLLRVLRKVLNSGGSIFIRDMDDRLAVAHPDENNIVERMLEISSAIEFTGFRENGRQIYSLLKKSGFNDIQIHPESINTIGRSHDDREALFHINFDYVLGDLRLATEKYPDSAEWAGAYEWMLDAYEELEELFQRDDFFYQMGTIVFSAKK